MTGEAKEATPGQKEGSEQEKKKIRHSVNTHTKVAT